MFWVGQQEEEVFTNEWGAQATQDAIDDGADALIQGQLIPNIINGQDREWPE
jgi:hypothetical protein